MEVLEVVNDPNFAAVIKSTNDLIKNISKEVSLHGSFEQANNYNNFVKSCSSYNSLFDYYSNNNFDTTKLIDMHVEQVAAFYELFTKNPVLANSSDAERKILLTSAFQLLGDYTFKQQNPNNPALRVLGDLQTTLAKGSTTAGKLSNNEAIGCVMDATLGALAGVGGLIGTIVGIASGSGLTASALRSAIRSSIRIGSFALGGTAIAYLVGCILWEAWD